MKEYDLGFEEGYIAALEWCLENVKGDSPWSIIKHRIEEYKKL